MKDEVQATITMSEKRYMELLEIEKTVEKKLIQVLNGQKFEGIPLVVETSQEKPAFADYTKSKPDKQKGYKKAKESRRGDRNKRSSSGERRTRKKW